MKLEGTGGGGGTWDESELYMCESVLSLLQWIASVHELAIPAGTTISYWVVGYSVPTVNDTVFFNLNLGMLQFFKVQVYYKFF